MIDVSKSRTPRFAGIAVVVAIGLGAGAAIARLQQPPNGPEAVVWDREACAHCHMHVGDPHYAAQLQTTEGDTLNFDDPGCLLQYVRARRPNVRAIYFHDSVANTDRWWSREQVGFVRVEHTPMGFGLAAVARSAPGAMTWDEASRTIGTGIAGGTP